MAMRVCLVHIRKMLRQGAGKWMNVSLMVDHVHTGGEFPLLFKKHKLRKLGTLREFSFNSETYTLLAL
jgi:hypothetical protein